MAVGIVQDRTVRDAHLLPYHTHTNHKLENINYSYAHHFAIDSTAT